MKLVCNFYISNRRRKGWAHCGHFCHENSFSYFFYFGNVNIMQFRWVTDLFAHGSEPKTRRTECIYKIYHFQSTAWPEDRWIKRVGEIKRYPGMDGCKSGLLVKWQSFIPYHRNSKIRCQVSGTRNVRAETRNLNTDTWHLKPETCKVWAKSPTVWIYTRDGYIAFTGLFQPQTSSIGICIHTNCYVDTFFTNL